MATENNGGKRPVSLAVWISIITIAFGAVASFSVTKYKVDQSDIKLERACALWERDRDRLSGSIEKLTIAVTEQTTETKLLKQEIQFIRSERRR